MAIPQDPFPQLWVPAHYHQGELLQYQQNPLDEALPPILEEEWQIRDLLEYYPPYEEAMRHRPGRIRLHAVLAAADFFVPLSIHYDLEGMISTSIRLSYAHRNPVIPGYGPRTRKAVEELGHMLASGNMPHITNSRSFSIFGVSGMGKTTALKRILATYDQVIIHSSYQGNPFTHCQVVWLYLECPRNGSLSVLMKDLILELDRLLQTTFYRDYVERSRNSRIENLRTIVAKLASDHSIGLLVIDEVQNLVSAPGYSPQEMLAFLVGLENKLNIPVVLVGTPKAIPLFKSEFRLARRAAGQGDLPWDRMQNDATWAAFVKKLWKYQFTKTPCELSPELRDALYYESQGITDLAVKVYLLAQLHAIAEGKEETLSPERFHKAATTSLKLVQPFLAALRKNDTESLKKFDDIKPISLAVALEQIKKDYSISADSAGWNPPSPSQTPPEDAQTPPTSQTSSSKKGNKSSSGKSSQSNQGATSPHTQDPSNLLGINERSQQQGGGLIQALKDTNIILSTEEFASEGE